ncbi:MAG: PSD1 domain-containing protein [Acidobacteriia bacterium]|nr:PSD1 domain-containing protein [Terriglobia bacterium]
MKAILISTILCAAALAQDGAALFSAKVQPALQRDCLACHGVGQVLSKLDLRTREGMLQGGVRGPSIVPGNAAASPLWKALQGDGVPQMPPGAKPSADLVAAVRTWIDGGAPWPNAKEAAQEAKWGAYKAEDLWAFQPVRPPSNQSVDDFIQEKLRERGLKPAPAADRRTLIRRATIDLTGLPPTPEEVDAFVRDKRADAYQRLVERLLASPRYGERWGRHWLDVVRYADSSGYSNDFERPNAWRYRDYVIRSFNKDKPYDRFIREQIAGDEIYPGDAEAWIATGFLRAGPWEHTAMSVEAVTRQMFLDDVTHATASTFLGLTLGCARCHDHKFDPIPTRDYYRMQAVFSTTEFARPKLAFLPQENTADLAAGLARMREVERRAKANVDGFDEKVKQKSMTPDEYEEFKLYQKHMQLYRASADRFQPKAFVVSSGPLDGATDGGPNLRYAKRAEYKPALVHILPGGNVQSPADAVQPGLLAAVARYSRFSEDEVPVTVEGRRSALAHWIAHPKNPLTARVMVNRIWQYHFGRGLAADASNFGKMGAKPTHPELLDHLAAYFMEHGWSVKAMHRLIMHSAAYQRASAHPGGRDGVLLSHYTPHRVEAEVLRDSILAVSGELSLEAGGPGTFPQINEDAARQPRHAMGSLQPAYHASPEKHLRNRRTIYTFQQRSLIDPMVEVFNGPNLDMSCERREASTVATQAFTLLNGQMVHDMALALAARIDQEVKEETNARGRVRALFRRVFARMPEDQEMQMALAHLKKVTGPAPQKEAPKPVVHAITSELTGESFRFVQQEDPAPYESNLHPSEVSAATRALADLALVLLNSNEFVYVY